MSTAQHLFYQGRQVSILTQHGKQELLRGPFESERSYTERINPPSMRRLWPVM